jgi:GNAT superfamily N-acetyltransferase
VSRKNKQRSEEPRNMTIRRATAFDVVNLAKMLSKAREEQANGIWYPGVAPGPDGEMIGVQYVLTLINRGLVFVADLEGRLMGAIGMVVHQYPWSSEWVLLNEWFYVLPQFRDSDIARALLTAVEVWADEEVEPRTGKHKDKLGIVIGIWSGERTGIKDQFMERLGYQNAGGSFVRAPEPLRARDEQQVENDNHEHDTAVAGGREPAGGDVGAAAS